VPEAMVIGLPGTEQGSVSAGLPAHLLELVAQADVVAIGPGLDNVEETEELLATVLREAGPATSVVLDAYALGALSRRPQVLGERRPAVLTPNRTEAAHLLGREPADRLEDEAAELADRYGATVTLHGHVATPGGGAWREESGDAGLGTSGSGDVLAGLVAGLLARGADAPQAACWATFA